MPGWTVVVWAVVTPDLREAIQEDLREAALALDGVLAADIHVHVVQSGPDFPAPQSLPWAPPVAIPNDLVAAGTPGATLAGAPCWQDRTRRRLLVLWGHGERAFPVIGGFPVVPTAAQLTAAFTTPIPGLPLPLQPDLIGYDACRMASAETVLKLAGTFSDAVFIGSMVPEPASGWPYVSLLQTLNPRRSNMAVAAAIVEAYAASVDVPDWCLTAVELGLVGTGPYGLAGAVQDLKTNAPPPSAVDFFDAAAGADTYDDSDLVDLGALMRRLSIKAPDPRMDEVRKMVRTATFARRASGSLAGRDGLSVRVGLPPLPPAAWPAAPTWANYLPNL